jgi:hypothetical protein
MEQQQQDKLEGYASDAACEAGGAKNIHSNCEHQSSARDLQQRQSYFFEAFQRLVQTVARVYASQRTFSADLASVFAAVPNLVVSQFLTDSRRPGQRL